MAVAWPKFQSDVAQWLDSTKEKKESDTAKKIADAYGTAVSTAMISCLPAMITLSFFALKNNLSEFITIVGSANCDCCLTPSPNFF